MRDGARALEMEDAKSQDLGKEAPVQQAGTVWKDNYLNKMIKLRV